jgi:hypothetical protein
MTIDQFEKLLVSGEFGSLELLQIQYEHGVLYMDHGVPSYYFGDTALEIETNIIKQ